jgi:signal transduction histidine kinase
VIDITVNHITGRIQNEKKTMNVSVELPGTLPSIRADFDKVTQILNNLADNAFNYTPRDGNITIGAYEDIRSVVVYVKDTGVGIAKEKQTRIWDRFFRDEEQTLVMETSGTGLGLAIVREYVNMHEGSIWLESEVGKGTTFYVRIPTFTADSADDITLQ